VAPIRYDFRPGLPDLRLFPRAVFARATRRVLRALGPAHLSYADPQGTPELRAALAEYLGRVRHVVASPRDIVVCSGFAQGLGLIARALALRGARRIALEDPAHPGLRQIVREAGLESVPVPVDDRGLRVDRLARLDVDAVLVTAAHQFPSGAVLAPERRQALCAWAAARDKLVIEDDYDAEYRYDRSGVGAFQGLDPQRIVYGGSASKILAPALRLGWLVVPRVWRDAITEFKRIADLGSATFDQLVYADFLRSGDLDRHLRRMRRTYRRRRDALRAAIARHLGGWQTQGVAAGLHLVATLPTGLDEREVVRAAARQSIRVYPMRDYRARPSADDPPALVLGYAGLNEAQVREAVRRLAEATGARRMAR
jgi:GntR family transcriptional regulator/MocR family aminotransferase